MSFCLSCCCRQVVPEALPVALAERLREAIITPDYADGESLAEWRSGARLLEQDPCQCTPSAHPAWLPGPSQAAPPFAGFLELLDLPAISPLLEQICGDRSPHPLAQQRRDAGLPTFRVDHIDAKMIGGPADSPPHPHARGGNLHGGNHLLDPSTVSSIYYKRDSTPDSRASWPPVAPLCPDPPRCFDVQGRA